MFPSIPAMLVIVAGVLYALFMNYPAPPVSPMVYQWYGLAAEDQSGKYVDFKGYKIFYKDESDLPGAKLLSRDATVLCLHGFPTSSYDWYKLWPHLRRKFRRVIALDFLGFGYSHKPRHHKYSVMEQATLVEGLLKYLGVTKVHILAHDYGNTVAQELMARHRYSNFSGIDIETVCLLNGGIFTELHQPTWTMKLLRTPLIGAIASKFMFYGIFKESLGSVFGNKTQPTESEFRDMWGILRQRDGYLVSRSILTYIDERLEHRDRWTKAIQMATMPVHFIYGPADPVNPPPFADNYKSTFPLSTITVMDDHVGHYPQLESPDTVAEHYFKFLEAWATGKRKPNSSHSSKWTLL